MCHAAVSKDVVYQTVSVFWHAQVRLDVRKIGTKRARKLGIAMDGQLLPPDKVPLGPVALSPPAVPTLPLVASLLVP